MYVKTKMTDEVQDGHLYFVDNPTVLIDDSCPLMCGHCDGEPYNPSDHCCGSKQCSTGLINGETCECLCYDRHGVETECVVGGSTRYSFKIEEMILTTPGCIAHTNHTQIIDSR
ncbi:uncharacterized protein LOC144441491 [Glandiceps talaboti]